MSDTPKNKPQEIYNKIMDFILAKIKDGLWLFITSKFKWLKLKLFKK